MGMLLMYGLFFYFLHFFPRVVDPLNHRNMSKDSRHPSAIGIRLKMLPRASKIVLSALSISPILQRLRKVSAFALRI